MAATPELSPSLSSPSDEDFPFYSALSISAFPSLHVPTPDLKTSEVPIHLGASSSDDAPTPYTQHLIYPSVSKPLPATPLGSSRKESISWGSLPTPCPCVAPGAQPQHNQHRSNSLPHSHKRHFYRPSHPSFVKFPDSLPLNKPQLHGLRSPHPRQISSAAGTEVLISLAWTGEVSSPIVASGYAPSRVGDTFMWPKLRISDAQVTPARRASWPGKSTASPSGGLQNLYSCSPRDDPITEVSSERWTLADAISADHVTDETLVELLEELRLRRSRSNERSVFRLPPSTLTPMEETPSFSDLEPPDGTMPLPRTPLAIPDDVAKAWTTARRAFLVCRELIRTERRYLSSLTTLVKGETQTPPPPLMLSRLPYLIDVSSSLLDLMEANPSVTGVCDAFVQVYEQLEEAFVRWCEVVGQFFNTDLVGSPDALVKRSNSAPLGPGLTLGEKGSALLTRSVTSWGRKIQSKTANLDEITSIVTRSSRGKARARPQVRELAIMPTQRITRYVLLFRDLLVHSPPADIKPIILRASEATIALAEKSDRAQDHAAFHLARSA